MSHLQEKLALSATTAQALGPGSGETKGKDPARAEEPKGLAAPWGHKDEPADQQQRGRAPMHLAHTELQSVKTAAVSPQPSKSHTNFSCSKP